MVLTSRQITLGGATVWTPLFPGRPLPPNISIRPASLLQQTTPLSTLSIPNIRRAKKFDQTVKPLLVSLLVRVFYLRFSFYFLSALVNM